MRASITESYIKTLFPKDKLYIVWDTTTKGFGVIVNTKGKKIYVAQVDVNGKSRRKTIGVVGNMPFKSARGLAEVALLDMRGHTDILSRMAEEKRECNANKTEMTVADLAEQFLTEYVERHCKPKTIKSYQQNLEKYFVPKFGNYKIDEVTKKDIRELQSSLIETPYVANRVLVTVSKMYNEAKTWEICDGLVNPCEGIRKYPEKKRERYLRDEELECLHLALNDEEAAAPMAVAAFRLLLHTGARHKEIQTLKWDYVNGNEAHLPDSKTGRKTVYFSRDAKQVLDAIPRVNGNDYVIVGKEAGAFLVNLKDPWGLVRQRATVYFLRNHSMDEMAQLVNDLEDLIGELPNLAECHKVAEKRGLKVPEGLSKLRIHDLRHNFASQLAMAGMGLPAIGEILGHKTIQTTARYAHLDNSAAGELMKKAEGLFRPKKVSDNSGGDDVPIFGPEPQDDPEKYEPIYDIQS